VAQGYAITKILKILVLLDDYIRIAEFGSLDVEASFQLHPAILIEIRLQAMKRLCSELLLLIENSTFIMQKIGKDELEAMRAKLYKIRKLLPAMETSKLDQRNGRRIKNINEEHFGNCLEDLRKIKEELNIPLNRANLIFPESEEVDVDEMKRRIIEGG